MSQRTRRVDELLREEIGALLAREVSDPRIGFATITDVETSPDLRHAKVWVSVIGDPADRAATLRALQGSMGFVRHELGRRLRIKRIPELHIREDDSAERGTRVLHVLEELEAGVDPEEISPVADTLPTPVRRLPKAGDAPEGDDSAADGSSGDGGGDADPSDTEAGPKRKVRPARTGSSARRRGSGGRARPARKGRS